MRFERLFLRAFGPFTDEELDLSGGSPGGLHVIYGPNEAGKSTSLRAVKGLLFGIPHRSTDAHLHPGARLLVEAEISDGGRTYSLGRRKRKKDSLTDFSGSPLAHDPLPALLGHLDEDSFSRRFGLDQDELALGAEALLGGSEQGLFAAGTAGARARLVLDELSAQADSLFLARGRVPRLNRSLLEYERLHRELKKAERPPEKWLEQERAVREAEALVANLRAERAKIRAELKHKNRLRSQLSDLFEYDQTEAAYQELGTVPDLPEDARARREQAQLKWSEAQVEARRIREELSSFEGELSALPPDSPLCEVDDEQLGLMTRVGTALSARKDLPKREGSLLEQSRQAGQLLLEMGWAFEPGTELRVAERALQQSSAKGTVRRLLKEHAGYQVELEQAQRTEQAAQLESERLQNLSVEPEMNRERQAVLEAALADAQAAHGVVASLRKDEQRLQELQAQAEELRASLARRLNLETVQFSWQELARLIPPSEVHTGAAESFREMRRAEARARQEAARSVERLLGAKRDLAEATRPGLPSEEGLFEAKKSRNARVDEAEETPSATAFRELRKHIDNVDSIGDRLRAEADSVARCVSLARRIEELERERLAREEEVQALERDIGAALEEERARLLLLGVREPLDPVSAAQVYSSLRDLQELLRSIFVLETSAEGSRRLIARASETLLGLLSDPSSDPNSVSGTGLDGLMLLASRRLRAGEQARISALKRNDDLQNALTRQREAEVRRRKAEDEFARWQDEWQEAVAPLGLPRAAPVTRAEEVLDAMERLARVLDVARNLEGRILGMKRDTAGLLSDVLGVAERHAPHLLPALREMDEVDAAVRVQEAIKLARKLQEERAGLRRLIEARRESLAQAQMRLSSSEKELQLLMEKAGVSSLAELPDAEERSKKAAELSRKLTQLKDRLRESASGTPLSELREEGREWQGKSRVLVSLIDDLDDENQRIDEQLRLAESQAEGMRLGLSVYRSEDVVLSRQLATEASAEAVSLLREYLVVRLAHTLLDRQVREYAERFAGPLVQRASDIFERLTLGRYKRLKIGLGERVLRCQRGEQEVEVSELSRGTRAQLYFALRLSSLEAYFQKQPAVPLIFDDLFVDFDDDRATAAFEVLSDIAKGVQVLYFTHLARDVEAADSAASPGLLFQHRISPV